MKNNILNKLPRFTLIINDEKSCVDAIKIGGIIAMFSSVFTWFFGNEIPANYSDSTINYILGPVILINLAIIFLLGIFIFRKSRLAATSIFILFLISKLWLWESTTGINGWGSAVTWLLVYTNAMIGTYLWHSKYRNAPKKIATEDLFK